MCSPCCAGGIPGGRPRAGGRRRALREAWRFARSGFALGLLLLAAALAVEPARRGMSPVILGLCWRVLVWATARPQAGAPPAGPG